MDLLPAAMMATPAVAPMAAAGAFTTSAGTIAHLPAAAATASSSSLLSLGTLSQLAGPASLVMGGLSAMNQVDMGEAQQLQLENQIRNDEIKMQDQAIERRERLLDAISMQSARTGASGITHVGTPTQIMESDIEKFEFEDMTSRTATEISSISKKQKGKNLARSGKIGAGMTLLDTVTDYGRIG